MKVYRCESKATDRKYCFVSRHISPFDGPMSEGKPLTPVLEKKGASRVELDLDEDRGGLELPDLVGGRLNYLVMRNAVAAAIAAKFKLDPHDEAPVALINSKKRLHSGDYTVVNPHGHVDCLDPEQSELDGSDEMFVRIFGKWALKASAIPKDRDIFRVQGLASGYIFSERLVDFILEKKYTNFKFADVTVS